MCKYCKMTPDVMEGEMCGLKDIGRVKNGHDVVDLYLYRYYDGKGGRINALNIDLGIAADKSTVYSVKEKNIAIKYCPFCGEKF